MPPSPSFYHHYYHAHGDSHAYPHYSLVPLLTPIYKVECREQMAGGKAPVSPLYVLTLCNACVTEPKPTRNPKSKCAETNS